MYVYLATGTSDFMELLQKKYKKENMTVLYGGQQSLLMHITEGKTKFATPQSFEVVDAVGEFQEGGYFTITFIDIFDDSHDSFLGRIKSKDLTFTHEPGFIAYKLLRPLKSTVCAIIQQWTGANSYQAWKNSSAYLVDFDFMDENNTVIRKPATLAVEPYTKEYATAPVEVDEEEDDRI